MNPEVASVADGAERSEELELSPFSPSEPLPTVEPEDAEDDEEDEDDEDDEPPGPPPIFVDPTGRRRKILKPLGLSAAALCAVYLVMVGIGLLAGSDTPLTPWSDDPAPAGSHPTAAPTGRAGAFGPGGTIARTPVIPLVRASGTSPTAKPTSSPTPSTGTTTPPPTTAATATATPTTTPSASASATPTPTPTSTHRHTRPTHTPKA